MTKPQERDLAQEARDREYNQALEDGDYEKARQIEERLSMPPWLEAMHYIRDSYNVANFRAGGDGNWSDNPALEDAWQTIETTIRNLESRAMLAPKGGSSS